MDRVRQVDGRGLTVANLKVRSAEEQYLLFVGRYGQDQNVKLLFSRLLRVDESTIRRWWRAEKTLAKGEVLNGLRVLLHLVGFKVEGIDGGPRNIREMAEVLADDIVSLDEVQQQLGYANPQDVHRLLRGETQKLPSQKRQLLDKLLVQTKAAREAQRAVWIAEIEKALGVDLSTDSASVGAGVEVVQIPVTNEPVLVSHLIAALVAVLDPGEELTLPDERRRAIVDQIGLDQLDLVQERIGLLT